MRDTYALTLADSCAPHGSLPERAGIEVAEPVVTTAAPDHSPQYAVIRLRGAGTVQRTLAAYRRRGDDASTAGSRASGQKDAARPAARGARRDTSAQKKGLFSETELATLEAAHGDGVTAAQVVEIFATRGVRLSEASFRKYVQQGLLPRSRRVGRKGKHRGSMGVYPAKTVRRINQIKRLMEGGHTIEEIQDQFLRFADVMEAIEEGLAELFERMRTELVLPRFDNRTRRTMGREIADAQAMASELIDRLGGLSSQISRGKSDEYRSSGAAGSAEELL